MKKLFSLRHIFFSRVPPWTVERLNNFSSVYLDRPICLDVFLPPAYRSAKEQYPALIFNDGQDMGEVNLKKHLNDGLKAGAIGPMIVVAVHAGDRLEEYGTIGHLDYQGRGSKADVYGRFITEELVPYLHSQYRVAGAPQHWAIAGFSLGGLSAFDLTWNYPEYFGRAGVFSGSFWWRSRAFREDDPDADRIMHEVVGQGPKRVGQRYWFQTGTQDETADRNNNGIIDSIDDTLDLIKALEKWGCQQGQDIQYIEVEGGEHNLETWSRVMPVFLAWLHADAP